MIKLKFNIQRVLIAPLDWGLGHATRCIPLIKVLQEMGFNVVVACNKLQQDLLQKELHDVLYIFLEGYNITYAANSKLLLFKLLRQLPSIKRSIQSENKWLQQAVDEYNIDLIISDNRFGLFTHKIPCIFMTHQLTIKAPFVWLERWLQFINYAHINRYNACWVPDTASDPCIAGALSHPKKLPPIPVNYIGALSRFRWVTEVEIKYDYCIVLSGPEPQRSVLENIILKDINHIKGRILLIRGLPMNKELPQLKEGILIKNHLEGHEMQAAFLQSDYIISRSGFTTVMELLVLRKKSILIPTPGQTEQEYLASKLTNQQWAFAVSQHNLNLMEAINKAKQFSYALPQFTNSALKENIVTALASL